MCIRDSSFTDNQTESQINSDVSETESKIMENVEHQSTPVQSKKSDTDEMLKRLYSMIETKFCEVNSRFDVSDINMNEQKSEIKEIKSNFNDKFDEQNNKFNARFDEQNNEIKNNFSEKLNEIRDEIIESIGHVFDKQINRIGDTINTFTKNKVCLLYTSRCV